MPEPPDAAAFTISIGPTSFECHDGRFTSAINEPDTASGTVAALDIERSRVDWVTPATAAIGSDLLTTGTIVDAIPGSDGSVAVSLRSALMLSEGLMPPMVCQNLRPSEIVYAAAREAGFTAGNLRIQGLQDLQYEPLWVLAPVDGLRVDDPVRIGVVEFVGGATGREMLRRFTPPLDERFGEPLAAVATFARVAVATQHLYDAEHEGLTIIDTAAAWLTARLRYAWSHTPDGRPQHYERAPTRVTVERRDGVGVLAVDGARRWWRQTTVERGSGNVRLRAGAPWTEPAMPPEVAPGDRQALLALHRAATASDPVQRVAALWEAVEFYVGNRGPRAQFTAEDVAAIVERASAGLAGAKSARVENLLRQSLNHFPIRARLEHVLNEDRVPFTADDLDLLARLRKDRNRALHGATAAPTHDDIDRALALMSRAITTRWYRGR